MKRKEEIQQAMKESVCETIYSSGYGFTPQATDLLECAFTKGAEWADKTMLDRACSIFSDILIEVCPELLGYGAGAKAWENEFRKRLKGGAE